MRLSVGEDGFDAVAGIQMMRDSAGTSWMSATADGTISLPFLRSEQFHVGDQLQDLLFIDLSLKLGMTRG